MLTWFLMAKGDEKVEELKCMTNEEIERYLWQVIGVLSQEYQVHRPIQ